MNKLERLISAAEQHCSTQGVRLTPKRKLVLSRMLQTDKALSAYELADICKGDSGAVMPAMSIYRILDFLVKEKLAHKLELANKYVACEHIVCDHAHTMPQFFICRSCSKVKEVSVSKTQVNDLKSSARDSGFELIKPQLEMSCLCDECLSHA